MKQVNYIQDRDELEIVFKDVEVPEVVKLKSGISLEFDEEELSAILLPNFFQMIRRHPTGQEEIQLLNFDEGLMKIKVDEQIVNVKMDLTEV